MGMYVRALTYMLSHGGDGLAQAAKDAVLNANYVKARLATLFSAPFGEPAPACTRRCSTITSSRAPASPRSISPRR